MDGFPIQQPSQRYPGRRNGSRKDNPDNFPTHFSYGEQEHTRSILGYCTAEYNDKLGSGVCQMGTFYQSSLLQRSTSRSSKSGSRPSSIKLASPPHNLRIHHQRSRCPLQDKMDIHGHRRRPSYEEHKIKTRSYTPTILL